MCVFVVSPCCGSPSTSPPALEKSLSGHPDLLEVYHAGHIEGIGTAPQTGRQRVEWRCECGTVVILRIQQADKRKASGISWHTVAIRALTHHKKSHQHLLYGRDRDVHGVAVGLLAAFAAEQEPEYEAELLYVEEGGVNVRCRGSWSKCEALDVSLRAGGSMGVLRRHVLSGYHRA